MRISSRDCLARYRRAVEARDYPGISKSLAPDLRNSANRLTDAHRAYADSGRQLDSLVVERFGVDMQHHFHDRLYGVFDRMFDQVLLWDLPEAGSGPRASRFEDSSGFERIFLGEMDTGILITGDSSGRLVAFATEREFKTSSHRLAGIYEELTETFQLTIAAIRRKEVSRHSAIGILSGSESPPGAVRDADPDPDPEVQDVPIKNP